MKTLIMMLILGFINISYANAVTLLEDSTKIIKGGKGISNIDNINLISKAGKLSKVTLKSFSISKIDNIQNLMDLAVKENKVNFIEQFKYIKEYKNIKNGDKILLKCLKNSSCNLEKYTELMYKSPLHREFAMKYPNMSLTKINHRVGSINENIMNRYFQSTGWNKIEGEVGRNGIDGLFVKRKNGMIYDVMVVESKYNKSGLQHTKNGKQMTKQWTMKKIQDLKRKYPNNKDYNAIEKFIEKDSYRSLLWNLKTVDNDLVIALKKVHDRSGKVTTTNLRGAEKMKINFNGNQKININNPKNDFHKKIISWYKNELKKNNGI